MKPMSVRFESFATGSGKLQVRPLPLCPESDRQPSRDRMSRWAKLRILAVQQTALLFDDLVGASKKQLRNRNAERLGGFEVED
jgi:hypothetical protein